MVSQIRIVAIDSQIKKKSDLSAVLLHYFKDGKSSIFRELNIIQIVNLNKMQMISWWDPALLY